MARFKLKNKSGAPTGIGGRIFLTLFFLIFLAAGLLFTFFIARDAVRNAQTRAWTKTEALIISSEVAELDGSGKRSGDFGVGVTYQYEVAGKSFTSDRVALQSQRYSDYAKAAKLVEKYAAGSRVACYVNPSAPAEAVLERGSLWLFLALLFPLIFVAIGAGGIYFAWRRKPAADESRPEPISERASSAAGQKFLFVFFSIFLLMGLGFFYGFFIRPVTKIIAAKNWVEVPCTVLSSEVKSHSSDDGTTYSVNILYAYEFNGREHKSNRYHFMGGSSSGHSGKAAIVRAHPVGKKTVCYVNPADPTEAVLQRGFTPFMFLGFIPLIFVAIGAGGLIYAVRKGRAKTAAHAEGVLARADSTSGLRSGYSPADDGSLILKPTVTPFKKLLFTFIFAAFWNGIVSVFLVQAIKSWKASNPEWFLTIFLIPFALIGLGAIGMIGYYFLALFNPRPRLTVTPGTPSLGAPLQVEWSVTGRAHVLERMNIYLEGREEATYRRGTRTYTDKNVFARIELASVTSRSDMRTGQATVSLPVDVMHSFAADNNKIIWAVHVRGDIARWPDIEEEFQINVRPGAPAKLPQS